MQMLQQLQQAQGQAGPKPIVEFKAGRMDFDGKKVKPDRRKGLLRVVEDQSGMRQLQFIEEETKQIVEALFVFPGDVKFEKVKQSKERVYLLEFTSTQKRHFYWMRDDDPSKDSDNALRVHNSLNGLPLDQVVPPV